MTDLEFTYGPRKQRRGNLDPLSPVERRVGGILADFVADQHPGAQWTPERAEDASTTPPESSRPSPG